MPSTYAHQRRGMIINQICDGEPGARISAEFGLNKVAIYRCKKRD